MEFRKYLHVERYGNDEVQGIELGECFVFPKLDGTNGSIWLENGVVCAGSRNRKLALGEGKEGDNQGFYAMVSEDNRYKEFFEQYPSIRLYGEYLIPHSLKTYHEDAWRKFYVFDVYADSIDRYLHYNDYKEMLDTYGIDYIPPLSVVRSATYDNFLGELKRNTFLINEGAGVGEGIVIKNYSYENRFNRTCFAKMVTNVFKEKHGRAMGPTNKKFKDMIEQEIVNTYVDNHLIDKTYAKIVNENDGWNSRYIPQLLGRVYHDLITEEMWDIVKKKKNPTINFKTLNTLVVMQIKEVKPEIFN